eukprot:2879722-Ditylum_brightwellii.AAC.1
MSGGGGRIELVSSGQAVLHHFLIAVVFLSGPDYQLCNWLQLIHRYPYCLMCPWLQHLGDGHLVLL